MLASNNIYHHIKYVIFMTLVVAEATGQKRKNKIYQSYKNTKFYPALLKLISQKILHQIIPIIARHPSKKWPKPQVGPCRTPGPHVSSLLFVC